MGITSLGASYEVVLRGRLPSNLVCDVSLPLKLLPHPIPHLPPVLRAVDRLQGSESVAIQRYRLVSVDELQQKTRERINYTVPPLYGQMYLF